MRISSSAFLIAALYLLPLLGCGGGGGSTSSSDSGSGTPSPTNTTPETKTTRLRLSIFWTMRSRAFVGPSSARSAQVTLKGASLDGSDFVAVINRRPDPAAYTEEFQSSAEVRVGTWQLDVRFFADENASGGVVGVAQQGGTLRDDGTGYAGVATEGQIGSVSVEPSQTVLVGERKSLTVTVRDRAGALLAIHPGAIAIEAATEQQAANPIRLRVVSGQVEGLLPGNSSVTASVDGVRSAPASIEVTSNAVVSISPASAKVAVGQTQTFSAAVSETQNQSVNWHVQEGSAGGSIDAKSGVYTAPTRAGTYHVVATSVYDPKKSAVIPIAATVAVTVSPAAPPVLSIGASQQFAASVHGTDDQRVAWSIQEGSSGGSITSEGLYKAPQQPGEYHVTATSQADPDQKTTVTVRVKAGGAQVILQ